LSPGHDWTCMTSIDHPVVCVM